MKHKLELRLPGAISITSDMQMTPYLPIRDTGSIPGLGRSLEEDMASHPIFLPGESHRERSLAGYNPYSCTELDATEAT